MPLTYIISPVRNKSRRSYKRYALAQEQSEPTKERGGSRCDHECVRCVDLDIPTSSHFKAFHCVIQAPHGGPRNVFNAPTHV